MLNQNEINQRLSNLETDMNRLIAENERLIKLRDSAYVELDACLGLLMKLAVQQGMIAGVAKGNTAVLNLPVGQVAWEFGETEAHLFENLPPYTSSLEEMDAVEKYRRVMNPGI